LIGLQRSEVLVAEPEGLIGTFRTVGQLLGLDVCLPALGRGGEG